MHSSSNKVVFIVHDFNFLKSHRLDLAKHLQQQNYEVLFFCPLPDDQLQTEIDGIPVHSYPLNRKSRNPINELKSFNANEEISLITTTPICFRFTYFC